MTDECYSHFLYDGKPWSVASLGGAKDGLVAGTVSKTYAMTGWRIGYGLAPEADYRGHDEAAEPLHFEPDIYLAEGRGGSPARAAGLGAQMLAEYRPRRDFVIPRLRRIPGIECASPRARSTPIPIFAVRAQQAAASKSPLEFADRLLKEANVAVVPGEAFGTTITSASPMRRR